MEFTRQQPSFRQVKVTICQIVVLTINVQKRLEKLQSDITEHDSPNCQVERPFLLEACLPQQQSRADSDEAFERTD